MKIPLRYGRGDLEIELPTDSDVTVIRKPEMPLLADAAAAVDHALDHPADGRSLSEIARGATTACIAICDITRPVPNHLFLRSMIERLVRAGIPSSGITVIVATGLHRPCEGDELAELVGDPWVLNTVNVVNHFARRDEDHVTLGKTSTRETVVRLDRRFVEADVRIATGLVEPHFMAGYSGGRKVIAPGLAHAETITTFHSARFMADPAAVSCNLEGNPLHEEQLQIIEMLGGVWGLNTVIDETRRLSFVNFGEVLQSHSAAVRAVENYCQVPVPRRFQTVITSAAGYPLDKTYYQTVKGMVGPLEILEPGGDLIVASACSEGMGSPEFVSAQKRLVAVGPEAFLQSILQKTHADIDEWQTQMQIKSMAIGDIYLHTGGLQPSDLRWTGVNVVSSLQDTIHESIDRGTDRAVAVIPEGPYVVPVHRPPIAV